MHVIQDSTFLKKLSDAKILCTKRNKHRVYLNTKNQIIKIFYMQGSFSKIKARVNSFITTTQKLAQHQINTITVTHYDEYPRDNAIVVYYPYLSGPSLAEKWIEQKDKKSLLAAIDFLFALQQKNINFKDFHPGNLIIHQEKFFLIDVSSICFHTKNFPTWAQCKNLVSFFTHGCATYYFSKSIISLVLDAYLAKFNFSSKKTKKLKKAIYYLIQLGKQPRPNAKNRKYFAKKSWVSFFIYRVMIR